MPRPGRRLRPLHRRQHHPAQPDDLRRVPGSGPPHLDHDRTVPHRAGPARRPIPVDRTRGDTPARGCVEVPPARLYDRPPDAPEAEYLPLPAGRYAVAMREAGAPASQPPVLTTEVAVDAGAAYTVAGVGRHADLGLRVLADDLSAPAPGQAKVRVAQASVRAPVIDVAATDGPAIADAVRFATTTDYREVEPGRWRLRLGGDNGPTTDAEVTLSGGRVYSLLVLDGRRGGLATELREDARGGAVTPAGGVPAGAGGLAGRGLGAYPMVAGALVAAAVVVGAALLVRRRRRPVW
ncbi:DUF4397 domain-containing protein [Micromonospora purpureochromogenes]|uniref:DUF4397 domain-containing protein n=1 Tax=Micromonospora purpureochromogenes TaxID=47872 RepID=UPI00331D44FF